MRIGASIAVGVSAKSNLDHLRTSCAPNCASSDVASVNARGIASDVLLGAGVVAVGVATVLFFVRRGGHEASPAAWHVVPMPAGGVALAF